MRICSISSPLFLAAVVTWQDTDRQVNGFKPLIRVLCGAFLLARLPFLSIDPIVDLSLPSLFLHDSDYAMSFEPFVIFSGMRRRDVPLPRYLSVTLSLGSKTLLCVMYI